MVSSWNNTKVLNTVDDLKTSTDGFIDSERKYCASEKDSENDSCSIVSSVNSSYEDNAVVLPEDSYGNKPSFGNISVENSSDIHFGNRTYYKGPVTIKQFLAIDKVGKNENDLPQLALKTAVIKLGEENPIFIGDDLDKNKENDKQNGSNSAKPNTVHTGIRKSEYFLLLKQSRNSRKR